MTWLPWRSAWQEALYGATGFYRADGPAAHFSTSAQGAPGIGEAFASALVGLARAASLTTFVDVGAGRGELLERVHQLAPDLACLGVDVCPRPPSLPEPVRWLTSPGGAQLPAGLAGLRGALVVANEWLDVVPCPVAELDETDVLRTVLVDPRTGAERLGDALSGPELDWCVGESGQWPIARGGQGRRVEVGLSRDRAWSDLLARVEQGVALAIDYGHLRGTRPPGGSLTGYRDGAVCAPVPDGSCDLTAHVAMDSLDHDELLTQRDALRRLGIDGSLPDHRLATADPTSYLRALSRSSAATALLAPSGLGGFWWAVRAKGAPGIP